MRRQHVDQLKIKLFQHGYNICKAITLFETVAHGDFCDHKGCVFECLCCALNGVKFITLDIQLDAAGRQASKKSLQRVLAKCDFSSV